jgi:hypothetical protein
MPNHLRSSTKLQLLGLVVVAAVIYYVDFGRSTGEQQTNKLPAGIGHDYEWRDASGAVYLVHETDAQGTDDTPKLSDPNVVPVATQIAVPYTTGLKMRARTYRLYHQAKVSFRLPLTANVSDLLIGETHFGPSQIRVARTMTELLRRDEVDAVFVEQPDDLNYDWTKLASLEGDRSGAIAAIQRRMIEDASADINPFIPYLKNASSDQDALAEIQRRLGPSARQNAEAAFATSDRYEKSEYVSAMDYDYVALRLLGRTMPFHNVESRKRRDEFEARSATANSIEELRGEIRARDDYMASKGSDLIRQNGYRQIIWIVGAEHLKSLPDLLTKQGHSITIAYDSLKDPKGPAYKKELMLLVKPEAFLALARQRPVDPIEQDLMPPRTPSEQLLGSVKSALLDPKLGTLDKRAQTTIAAAFASEFEAHGTNADSPWGVVVALGPNDTIGVKRVARGEYEIERRWPLIAKTGDRLAAIAPGVDEIDPVLRDRLRDLNAAQSHVRVFNVKDTGGKYAIYADKDARPLLATNDIRELVGQVTAQLGPSAVETVYLELEGFTEDKAAAFESSCRIQSRQDSTQRSITTLAMSSKNAPLRDAYFSKARLDGNLPTQFTVMDNGPFQGFVRATIHFLVTVGNTVQRVTIEVYVRTRAIAEQVATRLRTLGVNESLTLADMVAVMRAEIKKENNLRDEDVTVRFRQQVGETLIVYVAPPLRNSALG